MEKREYRVRLRQIALALFACALAIVCWVTFRQFGPPKISLSSNSYLTMHYRPWYLGASFLKYYENDSYGGEVRFVTGYFTHPFVVFPGPNGKTAVCFCALDTTAAVFGIDFTMRNKSPIPVPERLRNVVRRTEIGVRPCTHDELDYIVNLIKASDAKTLHQLAAWHSPENLSADELLAFITRATTHFRNATPEVLLED